MQERQFKKMKYVTIYRGKGGREGGREGGKGGREGGREGAIKKIIYHFLFLSA